MAHKTLVEGTAYNIKGGQTLIGGTAHDLTAGQTLIDGTAYGIRFSGFEPVFADNTWQQIIEACQANTVPDTWQVGDSKLMTIDGEEHQIDIIGKEHDNYLVDGAMADKAPLTFQLHGVLGVSKQINSADTNSGGWYTAELRDYMRYDILGMLPEEVAMAVRGLYKQAAAGNGSDSVYPMREFTFLLCAEEVFGTYGSYNHKGEGTQYEYYKNGGSTIKTGPNGSAATWWLRSAYDGNAAWFCEVLPSGELSADNASARHNISFGFCF